MGVLNITPDSFSDGGLYDDTKRAVGHGLRLLDEGADILDIGGESTRPGATRPLVSQELDRVVPVIRTLVAHGARVSVDTMRAEVAEAAVEAGATILNDVSGGLADPRMLSVVAGSEATYVAMHWRGHSDRMGELSRYDGPGGVVRAVVAEMGARLEAIMAAGVPLDRVVLDPGLGFAKTGDHNWELLAGLDEVARLGHPLLVGASRKGFLGALLRGTDGTSRPIDQREAAHLAVITMLAERGVWGVRVHDVRATTDALAAWQAMTTGTTRTTGITRTTGNHP